MANALEVGIAAFIDPLGCCDRVAGFSTKGYDLLGRPLRFLRIRKKTRIAAMRAPAMAQPTPIPAVAPLDRPFEEEEDRGLELEDALDWRSALASVVEGPDVECVVAVGRGDPIPMSASAEVVDELELGAVVEEACKFEPFDESVGFTINGSSIIGWVYELSILTKEPEPVVGKTSIVCGNGLIDDLLASVVMVAVTTAPALVMSKLLSAMTITLVDMFGPPAWNVWPSSTIAGADGFACLASISML